MASISYIAGFVGIEWQEGIEGINEILLPVIYSTCIHQCDLSCVDPLLAVPGLIRQLGSRVFRSGPALRDLVQEICAQDKDQAPKNPWMIWMKHDEALVSVKRC